MTHKPPRVLLLGDSGRLAYQRHVAHVLHADSIAVLFPEASSGRAACLDDTLETYLDRFDPDVVCFSCGPLAREELLIEEVPDPESASRYAAQVQSIAERCVRRCGRQVVFVGLLPLDAERMSHHGPAWVRARSSSLVAELTMADRVAVERMGQLNVMTADLARTLAPHADEILNADGVTLSAGGGTMAGEAVAQSIYAVL